MPKDLIEQVMSNMLEHNQARWQRPKPSYPHSWHDDYVHTWKGSGAEKKD